MDGEGGSVPSKKAAQKDQPLSQRDKKKKLALSALYIHRQSRKAKYNLSLVWHTYNDETKKK